MPEFTVDLGQMVDLELDDVSVSATFRDMWLVSVTSGDGTRTLKFVSKARDEQRRGLFG